MPDGQTNNDLSLEQIENDTWGDPPANATTLMATVHQLRRQPIGALNPENLRVLIAQHVGLDVLVPRALTLLEYDPLLEGDYYPGDVLVAVLRVPRSYWSADPTQLTMVRNIITSIDKSDVDPDLMADIDTFEKNAPS
jgi:hypothetical protein